MSHWLRVFDRSKNYRCLWTLYYRRCGTPPPLGSCAGTPPADRKRRLSHPYSRWVEARVRLLIRDSVRPKRGLFRRFGRKRQLWKLPKHFGFGVISAERVNFGRNRCQKSLNVGGNDLTLFRPKLTLSADIHWRSRSTCSLSTFYRLVHVWLLEHLFLFLKFNHLVHF